LTKSTEPIPSVLGELIYALEYRESSVESMCMSMKENEKLFYPDNLLHYSTMNTADRSGVYWLRY
jgi:hypothetical protein